MAGHRGATVKSVMAATQEALASFFSHEEVSFTLGVLTPPPLTAQEAARAAVQPPELKPVRFV